MKISSIGSLFSSSINPASSVRQTAPVEQIKQSPEVVARGSEEAVVVSARIKEQQKQAETAKSDKESRIQELKKQVSAGTYSVDSQKVAQSVVRDLA